MVLLPLLDFRSGNFSWYDLTRRILRKERFQIFWLGKVEEGSFELWIGTFGFDGVEYRCFKLIEVVADKVNEVHALGMISLQSPWIKTLQACLRRSFLIICRLAP
jgi:hypothetical protein